MSVFYERWIVANGLAEAAGLGTTFTLGVFIAPWLGQGPDRLTVLLGALSAVILGMFLEGVVVGLAQEAVLRRRLQSLRPRAWVAATSIGAGLAWLVGMIPSTLVSLSPPETGAVPPEEPSPIVQYALAFLMGLVVGPILGSVQWVVLRRHVRRAARWLWANALAWAVGMPLVFLGMDFVPWAGSKVSMILAIYAACGVSGLAVGAVHGWFLEQLLREGPSSGAESSAPSSVISSIEGSVRSL